MTSKGRITIPSVVRAALRVKVGDRIEFIQIEPGCFALMAATLSVTTLKGLVRKPSTPATMAMMNDSCWPGGIAK